MFIDDPRAIRFIQDLIVDFINSKEEDNEDNFVTADEIIFYGELLRKCKNALQHAELNNES